MTVFECGIATNKHIKRVAYYLDHCVDAIKHRADHHDESKMTSPEIEIFAEHTDCLAGTTYGSDKYKHHLSEMKVALDHHYKNNRHHPEHFENGIDGMNLIDLLEMICDWKASSERHDDGDIIQSIEINAERFGIDDQLKQVLLNTTQVLIRYQDTGRQVNPKCDEVE